ncbi:MAG TPA: TonB-dependent receptor [Polyangia bacterium]|jgi:iron complex outermembrane receptor protein
MVKRTAAGTTTISAAAATRRRAARLLFSAGLSLALWWSRSARAATGDSSPATDGAAPVSPPATTAITATPPYETVVTAPLAPPNASGADATAATSVITSDRTPRAGESLPQLLSELPGLAVTRLGGLGASAFLSIRGSTWEQVRIYVDGVPLNLAAGGQIDLASIATGSIERIEIYRAMSPISVGTSALGGIVSITTRQPRVTGGEANAGVGSFGTRFAGVGGALADGPVRLYAALHWMGVRGDFAYDWDNGTRNNPTDDQIRTRQNNQLWQGDAVARAAVALSTKRELQLSLAGIDRHQGLPGFGINLATESNLTTRRGTISLGYTGRDDLGPGGRLHAQVYTLLTEERFVDPLSQLSFKPSDTRDFTTTVGATVYGARAVTSWLKLAAILDGRDEQFAPHDRGAGVETAGDVATRLFGSAGIEADTWWQGLRLGVIPSLRGELGRDVRTGRTAFDDFIPAGVPITYAQALGRVGFLQRPTDALSLKANVGRYARQPSFLELFGNSGFILGEPTLKPETAINGDVGASFRQENSLGALSVDGALFGAAVDDLIQFQQNAYGRSHPANVGHARILGVELSADGGLGRHARLVGQVTYCDARDTSDNTSSRGRQLPLRPRFRAYARPELRAIDTGALRAGIYADADVTSGNYLDAANQVAVPSRLLVGAGASLEWPAGGVRLTASLQNLTNSFISDVTGFPLPGRALYVSLAGETSHLEERTRP